MYDCTGLVIREQQTREWARKGVEGMVSRGMKSMPKYTVRNRSVKMLSLHHATVNTYTSTPPEAPAGTEVVGARGGRGVYKGGEKRCVWGEGGAN